MKKLVCFCLITLLLMNTMGYYAIFLGFQVHSDRKLAAQLDNGSYDLSKTITIQVPVSIPYMMDQPDYVRTDGKFLHEGKYYRIYQQKYASDTLTVVCVRDTNSEQIQVALSDYVKSFIDGPQQNTKQSSKFSFSIIKDFTADTSVSITSVPGWNVDAHGNTEYAFGTSSYISSITHPPC